MFKYVPSFYFSMKTAIALVLAFLLIVSGGLIYHYNASFGDITGNAISIFRFSSIIDKIRNPGIGIPVTGENITYPIHLSLEDLRNPAFSSVDLGKYQRFQTSNPRVFEHMIWANARNSMGKSIIYSSQNMARLTYYIALLESGQPFPYTAPPNATRIDYAGADTKYFYTEEQALNMWLPKIAVSLYVEVNHLVNWSIRSYTDNELAILFDGRRFLTYNISGTGMYAISYHYLAPNGVDGITDWNPFYTLQFLKDNKIISMPKKLLVAEPSKPIIDPRSAMPSFGKLEKEAQKKAIYALTQWMRIHLVHQSSTSGPEHMELYGYDGPFPLDKVLNPPEGAKSLTIGCSGTSSMYNAILGVINIPVQKSRSMDRHTAPLFTTVGIALVHGDDPYLLYYKPGIKEVPVKDMFVTIDEFNAINDANPETYGGVTPTRGQQIEYLHIVHATRQAYENKAYALLRERAVDVLFRIPSGHLENTLETKWRSGWWKPMFNETEIDEMLRVMDAEITRLGGGNYSEGYLVTCRGLTRHEFPCRL